MIGIYKILNRTTGKFYVGSSSRSIEGRWIEHLSDLRRNSHYNPRLQRAWNKYGEEDFDFIVLEEVKDKKQVVVREQYYLDYYTCYNKKIGYNICPVANSTLGYIHKEETKRKISKALKGREISEETRNKMSKAVKKRPPVSEETRRKMSEAHKGRVAWNLGVSTPEEVRKKISAANKGRPSHRKGKTLPEEVKKKLKEVAKRGEDSVRAKLTWDQVRQIRELYSKGNIGHRPLGKMFNVSRDTVRKIVRHETWKEEE